MEYSIELDKYCLELFPEMLDSYNLETLEDASSMGRYVFFESYFNNFLEKHNHNDEVLRKAAIFIEELAQSDDQDVINLTELGILEGLVNKEVQSLAQYLKPHSKKLLRDASSRINIDRELWRLDP